MHVTAAKIVATALLSLTSFTAPASTSAAHETPASSASVAAIQAHPAAVTTVASTSRDRQCRAFVAARLPKWWGPSGHSVKCMVRPNGYNALMQGNTLYVDSSARPAYWAQIATRWAPAQVPAKDRIALNEAPKICRQVVREFARLNAAVGNYRIDCVSNIVWKPSNEMFTPNLRTYGLITPAEHRIQVLSIRDADAMRMTLAHELGHAVSYKAPQGLRDEMTRISGRSSFEGGDYVGSATEMWAESFARYYMGRDAGSRQPRISPEAVENMLARYGVGIG